MFLYLCFPWCRGRLECDLKDEFFSEFKELLKEPYQGLPVVVVQFGKIIKKEGKISTMSFI